MNKAKFKKEFANIPLLKAYFLNYGCLLGFWTFADGFVRRIGANRLYEKTHYKRYQVCKDYLKRNYNDIIQKYQSKQKLSLDQLILQDTPIWTFWYQGEKALPYPVDLCLHSIQRHAGNHPVVVLNKDTYKRYVTLPHYIEEKLGEKRISLAAFSDILRVALLHEHGGIWLDSTYYLISDLQDEIYKHSFYSICHAGRREWVVSKDLWSLSLIACGRNNDFVNYCYDMLMEYWKREDVLIGYLLLDCIIALGFEQIKPFEELVRRIPPNNPHIFDFLEPVRNFEVNENKFQSMLKDTYIFKLTYKEPMLALTKNGKKTYFGRLIEH